MLKSKHFVVSLIVTPVLALIGYFATDYFVSEQPHQAKPGDQYQLLQLPDCRHASGRCSLKNGNFKVIVTGEINNNGDLSLYLDSAFALDSALVSVGRDPSHVTDPIAMRPLSDDRQKWQLSLYGSNQQYMRLAVATEGSVYYAESGMAFLHYETSFKKNLR